MLSSGDKAYFHFIVSCFIAPFSTSSFIVTVVFLFNKYLVIIQKNFYTARHYDASHLS